MNASDLVGTWRFPLAEEPSGEALLHFSATGRAIQFIHDPQRPERRLPMRLWYSLESPATLRFRSRPEQAGWTRGCAFEDSHFILSAENRHWVCTRATPEEIPTWFQEALTAALSKHDSAGHQCASSETN
jgi:hypothetical protein